MLAIAAVMIVLIGLGLIVVIGALRMSKSYGAQDTFLRIAQFVARVFSLLAFIAFAAWGMPWLKEHYSKSTVLTVFWGVFVLVLVVSVVLFYVIQRRLRR